ncbi:MAG TPA: P1 family peptidase [Thermoanaerobaculia bacterium]|nr:P1 family peptidase [Thermoanaerobaculia bacterium]
MTARNSRRVSFPSGYRIGHATDRKARTGCTVILPPPGTIAAAEIRGGAPGTRETGVFTPGNLVNEIHGLVFSGGSAFGLAAGDGVAGWLHERNVGFPVGKERVPIVAGAVLFDLAVGSPRHPDSRMGRAACQAAREGPIETGPIGAGAGATVGKLFGVARAARGGVGVASIRLPGGELVAALAAVNAFGDVVDPETGRVLAGPRIHGGRRVPTARALLSDDLSKSPLAGAATTLVCVATTVPFEPGSLKRIAIESHDGIARAVRPAHTVLDGDTVFALSPSGPAPPILMRLRVGAAAAEVVSRAIVAAVRKRR